MGNDHNMPDISALQSATSEIPVDDVIRTLGDRHARNAIIYLHDHPRATFDELADVLAASEASDDDTISTPADRERIRIQLYHAILPRLAEVGFVRFDSETNTVTDTTIPKPVVDALGIGD
ncbi:DUF7344 domain-containing protein [Natrinema ejinorense]|uniref:DUF7344 domain-containing protein n=1 Tax=Natrinema ejinorense TaxID=373386 RepID=A0A2A5QTI4_9EURY|nr:hypothetical protein [Natrinema ejinorense]PCR90157.1 hypothetical protein CP557_06145 [Natrinema ejinorense]